MELNGIQWNPMEVIGIHWNPGDGRPIRTPLFEGSNRTLHGWNRSVLDGRGDRPIRTSFSGILMGHSSLPSNTLSIATAEHPTRALENSFQSDARASD